MKKFLMLILIFIIAPIIGGIYGIVHDQLTYTISNEYYTKFKFIQFGLVDMGNEAILPNPRLSVAVVGFLATWTSYVFPFLSEGLSPKQEFARIRQVTKNINKYVKRIA